MAVLYFQSEVFLPRLKPEQLNIGIAFRFQPDRPGEIADGRIVFAVPGEILPAVHIVW